MEAKKKKNSILLSFGLSQYKNQENNSHTYITEFVKVKQEMPTKIENNVFAVEIIGILSQNLLMQRFLGINYSESCII